IFDAGGELCAQAAHIPVHLGSMAYAMRDLVGTIDWRDGDMIVLNDPYLGGTHLPDVTLIAPLFVAGELRAFVANRAHHADIGAASPGSMPISRRLEEEGVVIAPTRLIAAGEPQPAALAPLFERVRVRRIVEGDFSAQVSANRVGLARLTALIETYGAERYEALLGAVNMAGERLARAALARIPAGEYRFRDVLDDDGCGNVDLPITVCIRVDETGVVCDFGGTAAQTEGNVNCPVSVAAAAVYYAFRCLMPRDTPACAGIFRPIRLEVPEGCLLNARRPAAVAAGNVETSTRVVDAVLGALAQALPEALPAASHGSMNNLAMGSADPGRPWDYYETLGGGMGAHAGGAGLSAVQTHMTNTLNTPIETLEMTYPLRVRRYAIRRGSGGGGLHGGGDGLVRDYEFLAPASATILGERRRNRPWGLGGGEAGAAAENSINEVTLPGKVQVDVQAGDVLSIATAGAGGYGAC
ncbi:MAG TPA: hydantoinase B/oxoprolinase family protein, partial [Gammaproteobacteria bacterium]|nr:hydantoinase B/oxoprolinase family protein [Gammaproteobacteria bacterium]